MFSKLITGSVILVAVILCSCLPGCSQGNSPDDQVNTLSEYFASDTTGIRTGGIRIIPIQTQKGTFNIWTKRFGNNPKIKLLLLNGGPGATHEYFECMESFLPAEGIEFIYYDQLGCGLSDNPNDTSFWDLSRYVEEVEQIRKALDLTKDNFYLLGHSWGGILAAEYALKYQQHLKGLIISNMMMDAVAYGKYADDVLSKQMDPKVLDTIRLIEKTKDFSNPKYMELLMPNYYMQHVLRAPLDKWPEPVNRSLGKTNQSLYVTMQGPSEFGIAGKLASWDVTKRLPELKIPVLSIGGKFDTMDPEHMKWIAGQVGQGAYLICPQGSHMSMYDDQEVYMKGLIKFLHTTNDGTFKTGAY
jgi:proline iminopeptidase